MIPKECKRLAEVDFPIAEVSRQAAEKSSPKGYPFMLHLWWARRPLGACRAVLLGLLLPDPGDPLCPEAFTAKAREVLPQVQGRVGPANEDLRKALLKFIADFSKWDLASHRVYLEVARALVTAAHGQERPLVVDPFAGGGSIPHEALRLGCDVFASDLNPVACLILKVLLEDIPRYGPKLAENLRAAGAEIKRLAESDLADLYPKDPNGGTPIAYLWARTVHCESPNCGAEIPLVRSMWLSKKGTRKRALQYRIIRSAGQQPRVEFEVFEPKTEKEVPGGTMARAKATCLCCGSPAQPTVLSPERVRAQLAAQRGGADVVFDDNGRRTGGARMLAVVVVNPGEQGRQYRVPDERDYLGVYSAQKRVTQILSEWERGGRQELCPVPDEPLPPIGTLGFRVQRYGILHWGDLFTARQKAALCAIGKFVNAQSGPALRRALACAFSRVAMSAMSCTRWNPTAQKMQHTFGRQALPIVWDFAEVVPTAEAPGNWKSGYELVSEVIEACPRMEVGQTQQADAADHPLPDDAAGIWFTDPPYYDAVPYADLSDFFFVWLKRVVPDGSLSADPFDKQNRLTPKAREVVQDNSKMVNDAPKDRIFFESTMGRVFSEGRRVLKEGGLGSVVFAHKTTEGWEALLSGMIRGGWTITGSWPIATEMGSRLRARESAALATSVHLICRPRAAEAGVGDWAVVLRELPKRVGDWMERLQAEGVRGADLVFACIGPALELYSRYVTVESADGREVALGEYLAKVWEVVGRSALAQILGTAEALARNGAAGAVEEDARLTALFLWTLQSTNGEPARQDVETEDEEPADDEDNEEGSSGGASKGFTLVFDVVRRFAQPLGIELPKWESRVIETKKGIVRLLPISERAKQLFGADGAQAVAARLEQDGTGANPLQGMLFPDMQQAVPVRNSRRSRETVAGVDVSEESLAAAREATTLDRVHAAMLFQAGGRANALRTLLKSEQERGPDFVRLANALSALYPRGSEEKRLLDAMLLAVPR